MFIRIARNHISTRFVVVRPNDRPWFTSEIRRQIRIRDRLRKKALKSKNRTDITKFKLQRNKVNNMEKYAKENFKNNLDDVMLENTSNPKIY